MKKTYLKERVSKLLLGIICTWLMFCATTIDNLGNSTYNLVLIIYTSVAILSFVALKKYSRVFNEID